MVQRHLDIKPFLSFPMEPQPALGLFPRFSTMDPVHKPVMSPNFGVPLIKTKRPVISCNVCQIRFNSESQAEAHYKGNRHARRVKGIENAKTRQKDGVQDGDRNTLLISPVPSVSESDTDSKGTKHKTILEARSGLGPIKAYPRLGGLNSGSTGTVDSNNQERTFHCEICNVRVTSEGQLKQHISSRRHRDGVSGKPNPLLSRHKKQQTLQELTASLVFPKDLSKTLSAGLLPSPLAVAMAAAAVSSPLSLRPTATPPLLQAPPLTHHMLRPAPGPIRTAHGTILFSPY
uniref:C2H2-type domain-containing protein n=1 Tax=Pyxicephalus adspersus TaxID=30357 RepID=A0AAV3AMT5_PYXAD|nr:TPA: hypothetical protein GDO54_000526 [Pyxicephalus adspersus]